MKAEAVKNRIAELENNGRALFLAKFFKTGPGQYAEGDHFLGLTMPEQRTIVGHYADLPDADVEVLIQDSIHECRMVGLLIWAKRVKRASSGYRQALAERYVALRPFINNWDLVDNSCTHLLGDYLLHQDRSVLYDLAAEDHLWSNRMAIVSTLSFIRRGQFADTFALIEQSLTHRHSLIHRAMGWMLREVGKRSPEALEEFVNDHHRQLPRTTLRYAVERMPALQRQQFMAR